MQRMFKGEKYDGKENTLSYIFCFEAVVLKRIKNMKF